MKFLFLIFFKTPGSAISESELDLLAGEWSEAHFP